MKLKTIITAYDIDNTTSLTPEQIPIAVTVGMGGLKAKPVERQDELGVDITLESAVADINGSSTSSSIQKDVTVGADSLLLKGIKVTSRTELELVIAGYIDGGIDDAPSDGNIYGRKDGEWQEIDTITDAERQQIKTNTDNITANATAIKTLQDNCLTDAPSDGKQYVRKDGEWVEVSGGGGGSIEWDE